MTQQDEQKNILAVIAEARELITGFEQNQEDAEIVVILVKNATEGDKKSLQMTATASAPTRAHMCKAILGEHFFAHLIFMGLMREWAGSESLDDADRVEPVEQEEAK